MSRGLRLASLSCLVLLACRVESRYPSIELGSGVSLAFPALRIVVATDDTLTVPWSRVQPDFWKARFRTESGMIEGELRVRTVTSGKSIETKLTIATPGTLGVKEVWPIWLEGKAGFFDFSTGEPPAFRFPGDSTTFRLEPGSYVERHAVAVLSFQPLSKVFCRIELEPFASTSAKVRLRRQSGRATKRRYDLGLGWVFPEPLMLRPSQPLRLRLRGEVASGRDAERRWERTVDSVRSAG